MPLKRHSHKSPGILSTKLTLRQQRLNLNLKRTILKRNIRRILSRIRPHPTLIINVSRMPKHFQTINHPRRHITNITMNPMLNPNNRISQQSLPTLRQILSTLNRTLLLRYLISHRPMLRRRSTIISRRPLRSQTFTRRTLMLNLTTGTRRIFSTNTIMPTTIRRRSFTNHQGIHRMTLRMPLNTLTLNQLQRHSSTTMTQIRRQNSHISHTTLTNNITTLRRSSRTPTTNRRPTLSLNRTSIR